MTPAPGKWNATQPVEWSALLADTMHLSTEELGAYMLLIGAYWQQAAPLTDDDIRLARLARVPQERWTTLRGVLAPFFQINAGFWHHKRIDADLASTRDLHERRVAQTHNARQVNPKNQRTVTDTVTEKIYQAYPRRVGKPHALRSIAKALSGGVDPAWLLEVTRLWADMWKHRDIQFCPYPSTWFNQERYNDQLEMQLHDTPKPAGNGAATVVHQQEYERLLARMAGIRRQYADHQTWSQEDREEWRKLKTRKDQLMAMLGITV